MTFCFVRRFDLFSQAAHIADKVSARLELWIQSIGDLQVWSCLLCIVHAFQSRAFLVCFRAFLYSGDLIRRVFCFPDSDVRPQKRVVAREQARSVYLHYHSKIAEIRIDHEKLLASGKSESSSDTERRLRVRTGTESNTIVLYGMSFQSEPWL